MNNKLLIINPDCFVRTIIKSPLSDIRYDWLPLSDSLDLLNQYKKAGYDICAIANKQEVYYGYITLKEVVEQFYYFLDLFPCVECVYFCWDEGFTCKKVSNDINESPVFKTYFDIDSGYLKPGHKMFSLALEEFKAKPDESLAVGNSEIEEQPANTLSIPYLNHDRFKEILL